MPRVGGRNRWLLLACTCLLILAGVALGGAWLGRSAPPNPLNRLVKLDSDHMGTPQAAIDAVLAWLASLPPH